MDSTKEDNTNNTTQKKILIVEDELLLMRALNEKLSREGFSIIKASNGKEGLEAALTLHPNLILLDVVMPIMDGITMLKTLRQDTWGAQVPILLLTNLSEGNLIKQGQEQHVLDYLIKSDWTLDDLVKKVKKVLQ